MIETLLVEDDIDLSSTLIDVLAGAGIDCDHAANGRLGLNLALEQRYDVLIVDVSMPKLDGLGLCEALRVEGRDVPILMLTARSALDDKLAGFDAGADDYLTKPFEVAELIARVRALAGRRSSAPRIWQIGELRLDLDRLQATRHDRTLALTPTGWRMLLALVRAAPATASYAQLYAAGWREEAPTRNSFNVQLHKLRRALDAPGERPMLHTVAGTGVRLESHDV